jgi:glycosidase
MSLDSSRHCSLRLLVLAVLLLPSWFPAAQARVMLQYFESRWQTIERRMPDVFMAGYGGLYVPPPTRADSSDYSVGYDVYDRFDLGYEGRPTLYGTENMLDQMVRSAHDAGIYVYVDTMYNHNGFSNGFRGDTTAGACQLNWAIQDGGYPGFVMSGRDLNLGLPDDFNLEFRNICSSTQYPAPSCDTDPIHCQVSGLLDINPDRTTLFWIRHPAVAGNPENIPYQTPKASNRRLYPDVDLASPYDDSVRPFNLAEPMLGDPYTENVNGMLQRWTQWMLEVHRVDGFRLDAIKHIDPAWLTNVYDYIAHNRARDFWGRQVSAFSFGENPDGSNANLAAYHRKDGYGNRTVLDFPLKYAMVNNIGNASANFAAILGTGGNGGNTFDNYDDGLSQNGSAGVSFVQNHDNGLGDPPQIDNVAYAYILNRKGYPLVYYNAQEFGTDRPFPNNNTRKDALGLNDNIITALLQTHRNFVGDRSGNDWRSLYESSDVVAYEMNNTLIVAMSDWVGRGPTNAGYIEVSVDNLGFRNVTLTEVTGNAASTTIDPNSQIPDIITVPASGPITLRIPTTQNANGVTHNRPYVMYSLLPPQGTFSLLNKSGTIAADGSGVAEARRRLTAVDIVSAATAQLQLQISNGGAVDDQAGLRWDYGVNIDGSTSGTNGLAYGIDDPLFAGFDAFRTINNPSSTHPGAGLYRQDVDLTNPAIKEGFHYLTAMAFVQRSAGLPVICNTFRKVIYVDRQPPNISLAFPANADGIADVDPGTYEFVVDNPDLTGTNLHYFWNLDPRFDPLSLVSSANQASQTDRGRWRFLLSNLAAGNYQKLTLVLFEESGNYRIQTFLIGVKERSAIASKTWAGY